MAATINRLHQIEKDAERYTLLGDTSEATQNLHRLAVLIIEIRRKAQIAKGVADERCQVYNKTTLL